MDYLTVKALHIIFVVTWFAGLFYLPRLFIYQVEALEKPEPDRSILLRQLSTMARRLLYIITWPSAVIALATGSTLLVRQPEWLSMPFMHLKLGFVGLLVIYHFSLQWIFGSLQQEKANFSSTKFRILNEVATILLIAIVFVIVKKDQFSWIWGTVGILLVALVLMAAVKVYKKYRERSV